MIWFLKFLHQDVLWILVIYFRAFLMHMTRYSKIEDTRAQSKWGGSSFIIPTEVAMVVACLSFIDGAYPSVSPILLQCLFRARNRESHKQTLFYCISSADYCRHSWLCLLQPEWIIGWRRPLYFVKSKNDAPSKFWYGAIIVFRFFWRNRWNLTTRWL